jgi:hypothetical protein
MRLLAERASGLRHLRWAREIQATLEAHAAHHGTAAERQTWKAEAAQLAAVIAEVREAVKVYRDYLERVRVKRRGALRAARWLDEEVALRIHAEHRALEVSERAPLKDAVRAGVRRLRDTIAVTLERCERRFGAEITESLLPPLTADGLRIADDDDEDDDATGPEA